MGFVQNVAQLAQTGYALEQLKAQTAIEKNQYDLKAKQTQLQRENLIQDAQVELRQQRLKSQEIWGQHQAKNGVSGVAMSSPTTLQGEVDLATRLEQQIADEASSTMNQAALLSAQIQSTLWQKSTVDSTARTKRNSLLAEGIGQTVKFGKKLF